MLHEIHPLHRLAEIEVRPASPENCHIKDFPRRKVLVTMDAMCAMSFANGRR
jgi:hypothetical protein